MSVIRGPTQKAEIDVFTNFFVKFRFLTLLLGFYSTIFKISDKIINKINFFQFPFELKTPQNRFFLLELFYFELLNVSLIEMSLVSIDKDIIVLLRTGSLNKIHVRFKK